jgi:hypothetical protein
MLGLKRGTDSGGTTVLNVTLTREQLGSSEQ